MPNIAHSTRKSGHFNSDSPPYLLSWWAKDTDGISQAIRTALSHQNQLEAAIADLKQLRTASANGDGDKYEALLHKLETSVKGSSEFISSISHPIFYNELRAATGEPIAARTVCEISELLEKILLDSTLDTTEIKTMLPVSEIIRSNILGSPKLLRRSFLVADPESYFRLPPFLTVAPEFSTGVDLTFSIECSRAYAQVLNAKFETIITGKLPRIGEDHKALLLCQPPIRCIDYTISCCYDITQLSHVSAGVVTSTTGLTVGDLYERTRKIMAAHSLCPKAPANHLDNNGYVKAEVYFSGDVKFQEDNPFLEANIYDVPKYVREKVTHTVPTFPTTTKMETYTKVKQAAWLKGQAILTLREFEAATALGGRWQAYNYN